MDSKNRHAKRVSLLAKEYLLANPSASNDDVVKTLGCSPRLVTAARAALVQQGLIQRSYFDHQPRAAGPPEIGLEAPSGPSEGLSTPLPLVGPRDPVGMAQALQIDQDPSLTVEQMRQRYSALARYAQRTGEFTLEIQAMTSLARLDAQTGVRDRLGPGVPHTREERRNRVVPILDAAGPSIAAESVVIAFEKPEFTTFIDELGRFMARKVPDGVDSSKDQTPAVDGPTSGDQTPSSVVPTA